MKAYRIDRFGGVDGIVLQSVDDPRPGLEEVLIRVRTSTGARTAVMIGQRLPTPPFSRQRSHDRAR